MIDTGNNYKNNSLYFAHLCEIQRNSRHLFKRKQTATAKIKTKRHFIPINNSAVFQSFVIIKKRRG